MICAVLLCTISAIRYLLKRVILLGIVDLVRFVFAAATSASRRDEAKQCGSLIGPDRTHTNQLIKFVFAAIASICMIDIGRTSRSVQDAPAIAAKLQSIFGIEQTQSVVLLVPVAAPYKWHEMKWNHSSVCHGQ